MMMKLWKPNLLAALLLAAALLAGCARTPEQKYARFLETGKKLLDRKDYARALLQFRNAAKTMPKAAEPYYQMSRTYLPLRDGKSAVWALKQALKLDPHHAGAQLALAGLETVSTRAQDVQDAERRAQEVLAASPENVEALNALAAAEWRLGKKEGAEEHLQQAFDRFPQNLSASVGLARVKLAKGDISGAEAVLKKAAEQQPPAVNNVLALGEFYFAQGKPEESEKLLRRALEIDGNNARALLDVASVNLRQGKKAEAEEAYKRLSALPEKRYQPLYGAYLIQNGKLDQGLAEFARLAKQDREDRAARSRLVAAYVFAKKVPEAMSVLAAALKTNPKDTEALLQRGRIYLMSRQYAEAQADLDQALRSRGDSAEAHYLMAKVHEARGATLSQKQQLSEAVRLNPNLLVARIELSRLLIASQAAKESLQLMDETPQSQRRTFAAVAQRNWALIASGDRNGARRILDAILAKVRPVELLLQDAVLKIEKNPVDARAALADALKQSPEDTRVLRLMTATYMAQKLPGTAVQFLRDHAAQHPKSAPVQLFLAQWLLSTGGNRAQARAALNAAKVADAGFVPADLMLAQLDLAERQFDQARQTLNALVARSPTSTAPRMLLGVVALQQGDPAQAILEFRKVVEIEPNNVLALNDLAYSLADAANQPDEALPFAQKAAELAPNSPAVEDTLGWVLYRKGLYSMAIKHLESAVAGGGTARRQAHLALAYLRLGDSTRGQASLDKALDQDPNLPEVKLAQKVADEISSGGR